MIAAAFSLAFSSDSLAQSVGLAEIQCEESEVCRVTQTRLPLRVLSRPFAALYKEASQDELVSDNIPDLVPYYVFERREVDYSDPAAPQGWYQIGPTDLRPIGWLQAADAIEWTQTLIVSYAHPGSDDDMRRPVIGFSKIDPVLDIVESLERSAAAEAVYSKIDAGNVPEEVVVREPQPGWLDIEEQFYMLPIIDFIENEAAERDQPERLIQVIAAVPGQRASTPPDPSAEISEDAATNAALGERLGELSVDVVFVIDLTNSMGPFIEQTKRSIESLAFQLEQKNLADRIRFGLIGYRDNVEVVPGLEFTAKDFTENGLLESDAFVQMMLRDVRVATEGSKDYQEEVYAGVEMLPRVKWTEGALRFAILVGDASAHDPLLPDRSPHPQSTTGKGAEELRTELDAADVSLMALHLLASDPEYARELEQDQKLAQRQFSTLATNLGLEGQATYVPIPEANPVDYERAISSVYEVLAQLVGTTDTSIAALQQSIDQAGGGGGNDPAAAAAASAAAMVSARLVDVVGDVAQADRDVVFWTSDRALEDPDRVSMEVRILLSRTSLNDMMLALEAIYTALSEQKMTQQDFMKSLQEVVTVMMTDSDIDLQQVSGISSTTLFPRWLESLPYRSLVQNLSDAAIQGMTDEERFNLEQGLSSKIAYYKSTFADTDGWVWLQDEDEGIPARHVYPIPLDRLP